MLKLATSRPPQQLYYHGPLALPEPGLHSAESRVDRVIDDGSLGESSQVTRLSQGID